MQRKRTDRSGLERKGEGKERLYFIKIYSRNGMDRNGKEWRGRVKLGMVKGKERLYQTKNLNKARKGVV